MQRNLEVEGEREIGELVEIEDEALAGEDDEVAQAISAMEAVFAGEAAELEFMGGQRILHNVLRKSFSRYSGKACLYRRLP